mmetsp:Transcript_47309/g.106244  ORF Transcript_47309/g.106244 Transcript_47309/m.106244 type:complete len:292 (+) Transcript_47309:300-1175(+)
MIETRPGTAGRISGATSFKAAAAHKQLDDPCGFKWPSCLGMSCASAATACSTSGASSFRVAAAHRLLDNCCGFILSSWLGMLFEGATACSIPGSASFRVAAAHRLLETACGPMLSTWPGTRPASAGTTFSTSGATSFRVAAAHRQLATDRGSISKAFPSSARTMSGTTFRKNLSFPSQIVASDHNAFVSSRCDSSSCCIIVTSRDSILAMTSPFKLSHGNLPACFNLANFVKTADMWMELNSGFSTTFRTTFMNSNTDSASLILQVRILGSVPFPLNFCAGLMAFFGSLEN